MFPLAILIGVYSYLIFVLGISHLLYPVAVLVTTILWIICTALWFKKDIVLLKKYTLYSKKHKPHPSRFSVLLIILLSALWAINFFGLLAPERAFDALWYHLTIPKIFIENHAIFYIPGGLFYYSLMPKLVDLLYIPALMIGGSFAAKIIHFTFGILILVVIYKISKYFLSHIISLLVLLVFSANLVVAWESTTAYIDLGRAFFEVMAFYGIVLYIMEKKKLWLTESAIMLGFAISTKLLAITSLPILLSVVLYIFKDRIKIGIKESVKYLVTAMAIPLPYFIFSFINTGNPIYPLFTKYYKTHLNSDMFFPLQFIKDIFMLFVRGDDPVSPIYIIVLPLIFFIYKKLGNLEKLVMIYSLASIFIWYITPRTGGGRFILPYLPIMSLMVGVVLNQLKNKIILNTLIATIIFLALITLFYRATASYKYIPVVFGTITDDEFLSQNLQFDYGDFYDTDGYFKETINDQDTVLVYGVHNLYYMNFPFIHESYVKKGDEFNYILAPTKARLPERFYMWHEVYSNPVTGLSLYSQRKNTWVY